MKTCNPAPDDLSFVAEALLALCEHSFETPFYGEERLRQKRLLAEQRERRHAECVIPVPADVLLQRECEDVFRRASLTARQSDVFFRRLAGWTFEEIGSAFGNSKQAAQRVFVQALKKISRAFRVYPFKGLSEVYRWETHRGLRRLA